MARGSDPRSSGASLTRLAIAAGVGWIPAFIALSLVYFYSHYFFASNTAHISSMYAAFLAVAVTVGAPPLFGAGYVSLAAWWRLGALVSVINIAIWFGIGGLWWKLLSLW